MLCVTFLRFELHYVAVQCWIGLGWITSDYISRGLAWVGSVKSWVGLGWVTENGPTAMAGWKLTFNAVNQNV